MRKKLIASLSIIAIFAFAIAAFAYAQNVNVTASSVSSSMSKDSCPMKAKGHEGNADHSKMDCCKHEAGKACDCCGDSCPMKKGEGSSATAVSTEGKDCCDNCDCCKGEKETSV